MIYTNITDDRNKQLSNNVKVNIEVQTQKSQLEILILAKTFASKGNHSRYFLL